MKKVRLLVTVLFLVMCVCGCTSRQNAFTYSKINAVTISFESNENTFSVVEIDFEKALKHRSDYSDDKTYDCSESFENGEALEAYLRETVIPAISARNSETQNEDSLLVWKVEILTDGGRLTRIGTKEDQYPDYWETLLALIC